jgi:hypothetical protein
MVDGHAAGQDTQLSAPATPVSLVSTEHESDNESSATTVPETVMAEQVTKDVVKEAQSVGRPAPIDDTASTTSTPAAHGELPSGPATTHATTSEPTSTATNATSADAAPAGSVHVSGKDLGVPAAVRSDGRGTTGWTNRHRRRAIKSAPAHQPRTPRSLFLTAILASRLLRTQAAAQTPTSADQAAWTSQNATPTMCGRTR